AGRHDERIETAALAGALRPGGAVIVVPQHSELVPFFGCQPMRGKDRAGLLVPCACAGAGLGPGFQIADGVEDAATDLAVNRAGAIGAMLLKGSAREAEEICGFLGMQKSRRQVRQRVGHGITSGSFRLPSAAAAGCSE